MTNENKTKQTDNSVNDFIDAIGDADVIADCKTLIALMTEVSGHKPKMWGSSIVGFDSYHYKYDSGREGDACIIGFSPRKGKLTVYLVDGTSNYPELLAQLGKHKIGKVCVYFKAMRDIDIEVLRQLLVRSYAYTKSQVGTMHRAT